MRDRKGKVYIVGAGCGKADLITVRGLKLIQHCDALVYDDLIDSALLDEAPKEAERIYMGKRSGKHSASQPEISAQLVELAQKGYTVVRLKGGDPFVFGRGGEEILALQEAKIDFEEVPGISSAIAIPAAAGIPVTHRGLSRSVHIVTAHTADRGDGLPEDLEKLAELSGTLVFLMGLKKLRAIAEKLVAAGRKESTPAAVLSGGNAEHPCTVRGTLADIADRAEEARVQTPAVIVVGEVAAMNLLSSFPLPLSGKTVGITGTASVAEKLQEGFAALGADVFTADRSEVLKLNPDFCWDTLTEPGKKLLVFTSGNGVRIFFDTLRNERIDIRRLKDAEFAVIGQATGKVLEEYGIMADLCPSVFTSEALAEEILQHWQGERIFLFRSAQGTDVLSKQLSGRFSVLDVRTYTVVSREVDGDTCRKADYLCFSSAGGVRLFLEKYGSLPENTIPVCIGEVTRRELERFQTGRIIMAKQCTAEGMIAAVLEDGK